MTGEEHPPIPYPMVGLAAILVGLLGCLLWAGMVAGPVRMATGMLGARDHLQRAEKLLQRKAIKAAGHEALLALAAAERANRAQDVPQPLLDLVRLIPPASGLIEELPHLVAAAHASARAATMTIDIAHGVLRGPDSVIAPDPDDPDDGSLIRIDRIEEIGETMAATESLLDEALGELRAVDLANLPARARNGIGEAIAAAVEAGDTLDDARAGLAVLPSFLGADEPRTYLIGMQNIAEQRGTGGAILQFALLSITEGKPTLPETRGSVYDVDKDRTQISIDLPEDAFYVAGIPDAQRFGNSNWSPDWPSSAQLMLDYAHASDPDFPPIDGVIAVDPFVMEELLPGVGKYRSSAGNLINRRRVVHFVLYKAYASFPIPQVRRVVLRSVVDGFFDGLLAPAHPTLLLDGLARSVDRKRIQIWMEDPVEQAFVERMGWDGSIRPTDGADYVYVVEQNVGGNKLDYFSTSTTTHDVRFDGQDAVVTTEARMGNLVFLPQPRWSMGDTGRPSTCAARGSCPLHRPMLNIYVPGHSILQRAEVEGTRLDSPAPAVWTGTTPAEHSEAGKKVWSATLEIPPGEEGAFTIGYRVPGVVATEEGRSVYRLVVQHQPKVQSERLVVRIHLPASARGVRAPGFVRRGDELVLDRALTKDLDLEVSWLS